MTNNTNLPNRRLRKRKPTATTRMTVIMVLGLFSLLVLTLLISTGIMSLISKYWSVEEGNVLVYGMVVLAISTIVGILLTIAYSAIMVHTSQPYLDALQKIAECDFSVRIKDGPFMNGLGIAENFNQMAKRLESVETLREEFVSNFSHEFKTPIVSIAGFAKLLKSPNLSNEERNEYLDVIIDESNRLVRLSESVLMLSRLDSQTVVNEEFLLDEQIRQSMLLFERACRDKNIELDADLEEITVNNEKKLVSQIWVNLLSNAVKFTPNGGKIEVRAKTVDGKAVVEVQDTGCGMSQQIMDNIFNKFYQGDESHSTEGNGLGLSVVKKICDLLNIKIEVASKVNEGSTFTVTMDCNAEHKSHNVAKHPVRQTDEPNDKTE